MGDRVKRQAGGCERVEYAVDRLVWRRMVLAEIAGVPDADERRLADYLRYGEWETMFDRTRFLAASYMTDGEVGVMLKWARAFLARVRRNMVPDGRRDAILVRGIA